MTIDTKTIVSVTEANQNFSRVTRISGTMDYDSLLQWVRDHRS